MPPRILFRGQTQTTCYLVVNTNEKHIVLGKPFLDYYYSIYDM